MSDKEKDLLQNISGLPPALQDKLLDTVNGAVMAVDVLLHKAEPEEEET